MEKFGLDRSSVRRAVLGSGSEEARMDQTDQREGEGAGVFLTYDQVKRGDRVVLLGRKSPETRVAGDSCVLIGCNEPVRSFEMCTFHALRWKRHGNPFKGRMPNGFYKLWIEENIRAVDTQECIIWPFGRDKKGYARLNGRRLLHREECIHAHGEPPFEGAHAAHTCGKGSSGCVNPNHLEWKTPSQNEQDKVAHGTHNRGNQSPVSKLTEDEARFIRSAPKSISNPMMAAMFGVSTSTILRCRNRIDWKWMDDE